MPTATTLQARALIKILEALQRQGLDASGLLQSLGIEPPAADNPDARVPFASFLTFLDAAASLSGDPDLGLHVGEISEPRQFDVVGYAAINSPTLGAALERIMAYQRIWMDGARFQLEAAPQGSFKYEYIDLPPNTPTRHDAEMSLAAIARASWGLTGGRWKPLWVEFTHPQPANIAMHQRVFQSDIRFKRSANRLVFDAALLETPLEKADPRLCEMMDRLANAMLSSLPKRQEFSETVRAKITEVLKAGDPSLEVVAASLNMTGRTLQRRLRDEGVTHQELLDEMRRDLSCRYLDIPDMGVGEVAFLLGFAEPSAFHRAFKRWTGQTPGEYRRQGRRPSPLPH